MEIRSRSLLVHLLIAKSVIEALFVSGIAVGFFWTTFPPAFRGWGEVTPHTVEGWAIDRNNKSAHVDVQLFIDDRFVATAVADRSRADIVAAGFAPDPQHGYSFAIPSLNAGEHVAIVYVVRAGGNQARKSLQLVGKPMRFVTDAEGSSRWLP
jgi:hypothetical protein